MIVVRYKDGEIFTQPNAEYILPSEKTNSVTLMDIQHGIVGVINMDEVGGVFDTAIFDTVERLKDTAEPKLDLISRCELFNKLATIPTPPEANEFKAEVYKIIQGMEAMRCDS